MKRRCMLAATGAALLPGCSYSSDYPLSWDEEVLLHDGRMIVVRVTRYFTRSFSLTLQTQYVLRDMEIAFDAGPPWGRYQRRFIGYESIEMIDQKNGSWYLEILGDPGKHRLTDPRYPVWIISSAGIERAATSMDEIPDFPRNNILPYTGPPDEFFRFKDSLVKWDTKIRYWRSHPRAPGDALERSRHKDKQGDIK